MPNVAPSLIAVLLWGAMFTIGSSTLDRIDAFHLTSVRYIFAASIFVALLAAFEGRRALSFDGRAGRVIVLGTAGFAGFNLLSFAALETTSPEHAALVIAMSPLVTLLVRWARDGSRPLPVQLGCVAVAFAGVALVITKGDLGALLHGGGLGSGELLVLAAVLCWAYYTLGAADLPGWSPLRFSALTAFAGTVAILVVTAAADLAGWLSPPSLGDIGAIAPQLVFLVLCGAVIGVLAWNAGVQRLGPSNAALFMNLVPVVAFAIEAVRGSAPTTVEIAGAALTLAALVVANVAGRSPARQARAESVDGGAAAALVR
jgi:drug/metabolite transporter (DMT)-like permease